MRHGGSIFERPEGVFWARLRFVDSATGRRRELKRRAASRREAADRLRELYRLRDDAAAELDAERRKPKTFDALVDLYEREHLGELRNRKSDAAYLRRLRESLGGRRLDSLTYGDIRDLRAELLSESRGRRGRDGSPRTRSLANVNRILAKLRRLLNLALRLRWLDRNPMSDGRPLVTTRRERHRERILSTEEERRLLAAIRDVELRVKVVVAIETGLRAGELRSLRWSDVDSDAIAVAPGKTDRGRTVPLTSRARAALASIAGERTDVGRRVFAVADAKKAWATALRRAAIVDFRFHDLRHTFAARAIERGVPIAETQLLLGHRSASMTFRYLALDRSGIRRIREQLEQVDEESGDLVAVAAAIEQRGENVDHRDRRRDDVVGDEEIEGNV